MKITICVYKENIYSKKKALKRNKSYMLVKNLIPYFEKK